MTGTVLAIKIGKYRANYDPWSGAFVATIVKSQQNFLNLQYKTKPDSLIAQGLPGFNNAKIISLHYKNKIFSNFCSKKNEIFRF